MTAAWIAWLLASPLAQVEPRRELDPPRRAGIETITLRVVAAEDGSDLAGVELSNVEYLRRLPLDDGRVTGADGGKTSPFRSPLTLRQGLARSSEHLVIEAPGRVRAYREIDWRDGHELVVELARPCAVAVRVEGLVMPALERPETLDEELFARTVRPHLCARALVVAADRKMPGLRSEEELQRLVALLTDPAPDAIAADRREEFLALRRWLAVKRGSRDPGSLFPIDDAGRGRIEGLAPGRYLVTVDVHDPPREEDEGVPDRLLWITGSSRPLAAQFLVLGDEPQAELSIRMPASPSSARGAARVRIVDAASGAPLPALLDRLRADALRPFDPEAPDHAVEPRRDGDALVLDGPAGFARLFVGELAPPWYVPLHSAVELIELREGAPLAATIDLPVTRATGVAVRWRDDDGVPVPEEYAYLVKRAGFELIDGEGRCAAATLGVSPGDAKAMSLFVVPAAGRWLLRVRPRDAASATVPTIVAALGGTLSSEGITVEVASGQVHEVTIDVRSE